MMKTAGGFLCLVGMMVLSGCCVTNLNQSTTKTITAVYTTPGSQPGGAGELGRETIPPGQSRTTELPPFTQEINAFLIVDGQTFGPFGPFDVPPKPPCLELFSNAGAEGEDADVQAGDGCCN